MVCEYKIRKAVLVGVLVVTLASTLTGCMRLDGNNNLPSFNKQTNYIK